MTMSGHSQYVDVDMSVHVVALCHKAEAEL